MANVRQQRLSVSVAGPGYGPGRKEPQQRKASVLNFRAPKFTRRKKGEWNSDAGKQGCTLNRPAIVFVITFGIICIFTGLLMLVMSVAKSDSSTLRIVGPCFMGLGIKLCAIGVIAKVKNDKKRKQLKEAESKKGTERIYVDPDLGNISLADIENETAPAPDQLYLGNTKRTKANKGKTQNRHDGDVMRDFDSGTIPGLLSLPEVEGGTTPGSIDMPLIAYPNTPRDTEEIRQSSATYHMPMSIHSNPSKA